jgi:hypothetical protein
MSSPNTEGTSYNSRSIYNFERLTGAENFFIWPVRMLDVLADKDILYVIESNRPADPIPEAEADLLVTEDYEDDDVIVICNPVTSDPVASEPGTSDQPTASNPVASDDTATAKDSQPSQEATSQAAREAANAEKQKRAKAHEAYTSYAANVYDSQEKWDRDSRKGMASIRSGCRDSVLLRMGSYNSAQELWGKLSSAFGKVTTARRHNIKLQMYRKSMHQGDDVRKHVDQLRFLREELAHAGGSISEEDFKFVILFTLPESYESVVNSITAQDDGDHDKDADWIASLLFNHSDRLKIRGAFIGGDTSEKPAVAATAQAYKGKGKAQKFGKGEKRTGDHDASQEEGNNLK